MRPLDRVASLKVKLGLVIVAAVAVTIVVNEVGLSLNYLPKVRWFVAGALALAMVQLLARGMTSPLREMAAAARAMARGDYDRRVHATSRDEVGELARAFNAMAADLGQLDRLRRDLVANVSHELRTPIAVLQAQLENLIDGVTRPDPEVLTVMLAQTQRLGRLVAQLLDLSRLEAGTLVLHRQRVAIDALLSQVAAEARLHAGEVEVTLDVQPRDLAVDADPERLHQVIANLVENALRHSPANSRIDLVARRVDGAGVEIEVADEGPGIPKAEEARVFERFYRVDTARAAADGGAGLGLSIARWIVDLHGGDIRPHGNIPHGCRMVVRLPA